MSGHKELIDKELKRLLPRDNSILSRAMRYSIFAGGKRFRPALMIEAALCCGGKIKNVLPAASAVEMIHTFTLIHDDLPAMDDSDLRRGRPTCHKVFGEDIAILAGDALNTLAFEVLAKNYDIQQLAIELSQALIKVVRGQVMDLRAEGKRISFKDLQNIHLFKTAALIEASVKMGAIAAGANRSRIKALAQYARHLGLAFQIADDILDVESKSAVLGKPAKADQKNKKATYPAIVGLGKAKRLAEMHKNEAIARLKRFGGKAEALRSIAEFAVRRKH